MTAHQAGILQARTLEWVAISFSNTWKWKVKGKSLSHVRLFETSVAYQAFLSTGFSRQEYWSNNSEMRKGVRQGCILSPCLLNFSAEYIMQNAGLDEAQAEIKIAGRNNNNLRYTDDTTLMAESEEELKSLLMKVKEELA